jgi:phage baseplate assembly protein W
MPSSDIQIVNVNPETRVVFFEIRPKRVQGISKLIQIVVLSLLDVPGQDVLDPERGSGIPALVGSNIDLSDPQEILAEVAQSVRKTEREILDSQIGVDDDPSERLRQLQIIELVPGEQIDQLFLKLRIINEAGRAADVVV